MSNMSSKEPLNLLSLDGGGVRGVSELVMLDRIMRRLQMKKGLDELPRPCDYFDLIAGTSTGGLIAILLGRLRMTTEEALKTYDQVAGDIFSKSNKKDTTKRVGRKFASKFKASTLQSVVERIVAERGDGDLMRNPERAGQRGKAFVCAAVADRLDDVHRFRTYEAEHDSDQWLKDCKIWEAARATTAAPFFFKGIEIERGAVKTTFVDAALGCNNPSEELLDEAGRIFHPRRKLGSFVSLGTGTRPNGLLSPEDFGYVPSIMKAMKNITTSPEKPHERLRKKFEDFPSTYFRFNVPNGAVDVGLEEWEKMDKLKDLTLQYLDEDPINQEIESIVDVLAQKKTAGLTLGHIARLDKDQLLMDSREARPMGFSSERFVGRRDILQRLDDCFSPRVTQHKTRRHFLLCGMGGAGKTQIALKFAATAGDRFKHIFWVDAQSLATATRSYKDVAVEEVPDGVKNGPPMRDMQAWIASLKDEWLLILDNCETECVNDIIPPGTKGNIIYTSRHRGLGLSLPETSIAVVEDLETQDAITLLLDAAGKVTYSPDLRKDAAPIANELGCLALALDQAGSYIRQMGCSLSEWLELFRDRREILLKNEHFKGADPRNQTVYATFDISYQAVRELASDQGGSIEAEDARHALDILNIVCFYHNERVPAEMFRRAAVNRLVLVEMQKLKEEEKQKEETKAKARKTLEDEAETKWKNKTKKENSNGARNNHNDETVHFLAPNGRPVRGTISELMKVDQQAVWDWIPFQYGVNLLEQFSLVNLDGGRQYLSMHVLTHTWIRDRMSNDQLAECFLVAAEILRSSSPYEFMRDTDHIFFLRKIFPHFEALKKYSEGAFEYDDPKMQSDLDSGLGYIAQEAGDFTTAEYLYENAINAIKWAALDDEPTIIATQLLARLYEEQGRYAEAEALQLEVIERAEYSLGETAGFTIEAMYHLIGIYQTQIRLDAAETRWRSIIQRKQRKWGTEDPNHPYLAADYAGLDRCLSIGQQQSGTVRLSKKEKDLEEAIRKHGVLHSSTLTSMKLLALELADKEHKRYDEAEALMRECLDSYVQVYGPDSNETLDARAAMARIWDQGMKSIEAEGALRELLADYQRLFGPRDLSTISCLYLLGDAILRQGRYDEGILMLEKATELRELQLGAEHPYVVSGKESNECLFQHAATTGPEERRRLGRRTLDMCVRGMRLHTDEEVDLWTSRKHFYRNPVGHPNRQPELVYLTAEEICRPNRFPNHFERAVENKLGVVDVEDVERTGDKLTNLSLEFE